MTDIQFADVSEYQETIDADAYLRAGHAVIICRVHNGRRADHALPGRVAYLRARPFVAVGWYQYLAAERDASLQAHELVATLGGLRANEFPILDLEAGGGDQTARAAAWFAVVDAWAGFPASLYSGAAFLEEHLGGWRRWRRPRWIASYPESGRPVAAWEPAGATWWQFSDRARFAGIAGGVDASVFRGSAGGLLRTVRPPRAAAADRGDAGGVFVAARRDGGQEAFCERDGRVWHRWQKAGGWSPWLPLGGP